MGIEDHPIPVKPNSTNIKRKKNFPRDVMPRGGIRIAVNFHPFHEGQGERRDALIRDTQSVPEGGGDPKITQKMGDGFSVNSTSREKGHKSIPRLARTSLTITLLWAQS